MCIVGAKGARLSNNSNYSVVITLCSQTTTMGIGDDEDCNRDKPSIVTLLKFELDGWLNGGSFEGPCTLALPFTCWPELLVSQLIANNSRAGFVAIVCENRIQLLASR